MVFIKLNEITIEDLKKYSHVYHNEDNDLFTIILEACKSYILSYTGLAIEVASDKKELAIALLVLANEMYDNRSFTVENDKVNPVIETLLSMHSINLL